METPPRATQSDAIAELLAKSKRRHAVPLRRTFLQQRDKHGTVPGPLSQIVQNHDERALDLYLLVQLVAAGKPYKVSLEAGGWARALGLSTSSGLAAVSRTWKRLADLRLIARGRESRKAAITLLREDGTGQPYTRPSGEQHADERYLNMPLAYWRDGWYARLTLRAKAMLLVALSLQDGFYLPAEKAASWYDISADTAQRGFAELERLQLLQHEDRFKKAPLTTQGWTIERKYTLLPPFGPKSTAEPAVEDGVDADHRDNTGV